MSSSVLRVPLGSPETNVAELCRDAIARNPRRRALILPANAGAMTFGELGMLVNRFVAGLDGLNLRPGSRLLALAAPTPEIFALAIATLDTGHTLVTIDGRQDAARIRRALRDAAPDVVVGTPRVMRWWPFVGALRRARRFTAGRLGDLLAAPASSARHDPVDPESAAIMAFSSGNTGLPKRVVRTHAVLAAQHRALRAAFPLPESDVNLPGFPLAVLHNLCCGITTLLPPVDLRSMAEADVVTVLRTIREHGVTSLSGAPAFVGRLARHLISAGETLPDVRRIVIGGGPTTRRLAAEVVAAFPNADGRTVYGATEAEPIATGSLGEMLDAGDEAGGYLVGRPVEGVDVCIGLEDVRFKFGIGSSGFAARRVAKFGIESTDSSAGPAAKSGIDAAESIPSPPTKFGTSSAEAAASPSAKFGIGSADSPASPPAKSGINPAESIASPPTKFGTSPANPNTSTPAGEILVRGPNVIASSPDAWHPTGDVGRIDDRGRLWLLGRLGAELRHAGRTIHPFVVEERVARIAGVAAAALVTPGLFIQIDRGADSQTLIAAARAVLVAMGLSDIPIRLIDTMPMDARHQSKIDRGALR